MSSPFRSRQHAEELQDALSGRASAEVEQRQADLLRTVALLTERPPVQPRPEFVADLRERLMLAAEHELVAAPAAAAPVVRLQPSPSRTRRRLGTLAASLAIVGGTAGMAAAAEGSLPGDPLYALKRGGEQVVTAVQRDDAARGRVELRHAATRLDEARALQDDGADPALVVRSIEDFRTLADSGAERLFTDYQADDDAASVAAVHDFSAEQLPQLEALDTEEPAVQSIALEAADLLRSLDLQAGTLCGDCGGATALPASDQLAQAAGAASIDALLARPAEQARLDAQALGELDRDQIRQLGQLAEREADQLPELPTGEGWPRTEATPRGPVASTLTTTAQAAGQTVQGTTRAVDDLVRGLGDGLSGVTGQVPGLTGPLEQPVRGLTDTVDQALDGVTGVTGALSGRTPLGGD